MKTIYKFLQIAVKLCSVVITAPVTIITAGQVFADVPALYRVLVQISAVVLVETTFIASWLALEYDKQAPTAVKVRHALTSLGLYIGLTGLAIFVHGEGLIAGLLFRFAMLAALLGSIYDSGVYIVLKGQEKTDKSARNDWLVKWHARNLAVKDAWADLDVEHELNGKRRVKYQEEKEKQIDNEHKAAMSTIADQKRATTERAAHSFPMPIEQTRNIGQSKKATKKARALPVILTAQKANPTMTQEELAALAGVSRQTVGKWLAEVERNESADNGNGNGKPKYTAWDVVTGNNGHELSLHDGISEVIDQPE